MCRITVQQTSGGPRFSLVYCAKSKLPMGVRVPISQSSATINTNAVCEGSQDRVQRRWQEIRSG